MKKKIFLMLVVMAMLVCVFAISVSAEHDVTRKVTLDSGVEIALYDENGYALTYYLNEANELVSSKTVDVISVNGDGVAKYNGITTMSVVVANFQGAEVEALEVKQIPSYYYGANGGGYHSYNDTVEYIYLPDTLTTTVTNQFRCTSKLKIVDVTRNSNWQTMGQFCFYYATGLKEFYYPPKVKTTPGASNDGVRGTAATFSYCKSLKSLYFYDNSVVQTFGDSCFSGCSALETVVLPNSITALPGNVFSGCTSLKEITIPNSVKTIKNHAFAWCTSLEVIRMGASFEYFNNTGDNSFTYLTGKVKEIYIPKTFYQKAPDTSLGYQVSYAFHGVAADCKFFYCGTVEEFAQAKANFLTQQSATSNNNGFINASVITYEEYLTNKESYANGRYVICGFNTCDAFYGSEHFEDNNPCVINCTRCGANGMAEKNPVHSLSTTITYVSFIANGVKRTGCSNEGCKYGVSEDVDALLTCLGYSASNITEGTVVLGFKVNNAAVAEYENVMGNEVAYGVFVAAKNKLGENDIFDAEGKEAEGVLYADTSIRPNAVFEIKITGFATDEQKAAEFAVGAYVAVTKDGATEYSYEQTGAASEGEKYFFTSFGEIEGSLEK